jgi:hypothetical protein
MFVPIFSTRGLVIVIDCADTSCMTTTYTDAEMLTEVRRAIVKVSTGSQEYAIGEMRYKRADLQTLINLERVLTNRMASVSAKGGLTLAEF